MGSQAATTPSLSRASFYRQSSAISPHALADRPALYGEVPVPVFPADVRETQKVERLWLAFSFSFPVLFGGSPELDPARFVWMEFQTQLPQPFPKIFQKTVCFCLVLET